MKCSDCPYYWEDENEDRPHCHYSYNDGYAPCEQEDVYDEPEEPDEPYYIEEE